MVATWHLLRVMFVAERKLREKMGFVVMINEVVRKKTDMCLPAFLNLQ